MGYPLKVIININFKRKKDKDSFIGHLYYDCPRDYGLRSSSKGCSDMPDCFECWGKYITIKEEE